MTRAICVAVLLALAGCKSGSERTLPFYQTADLTPEWLDAAQASAVSTHRVGEFQLVDQSGTALTSTAFTGHITLVSFFFTECGSVCPMTRSNLSALLTQFPNEPRIQVLLHSVSPEGDSVPALAAYAKTYGLADPRWHLATGTRSEIERVARDGYFVNLHDGSDFATTNLAHTESILLIDDEGRIRGVYSGSLRLEVDRIAADLAVLLH